MVRVTFKRGAIFVRLAGDMDSLTSIEHSGQRSGKSWAGWTGLTVRRTQMEHLISFMKKCWKYWKG